MKKEHLIAMNWSNAHFIYDPGMISIYARSAKSKHFAVVYKYPPIALSEQEYEDYMVKKSSGVRPEWKRKPGEDWSFTVNQKMCRVCGKISHLSGICRRHRELIRTNAKRLGVSLKEAFVTLMSTYNKKKAG